MERKSTPQEIGEFVGRAIAHDVIADDMPREWTGLDPQDGDQITNAGYMPGSPEWDVAESAAKQAYLDEISA